MAAYDDRCETAVDPESVHPNDRLRDLRRENAQLRSAVMEQCEMLTEENKSLRTLLRGDDEEPVLRTVPRDY